MELGLADPDEDDLLPEPELLPQVGRAGRLQFASELARGGTGIIFRALDPESDREVAVKVLQERYRDRLEMVRRFEDEARIAGRLQHPGIVPVFTRGTLDDGRPYYAMKLVRGHPLAELLADRPKGEANRDTLVSIFLKVLRPRYASALRLRLAKVLIRCGAPGPATREGA